MQKYVLFHKEATLLGKNILCIQFVKFNNVFYISAFYLFIYLFLKITYYATESTISIVFKIVYEECISFAAIHI